MRYYLKKFWKANALAILPLLVCCALNTTASLLMMRVFEGIIERDLHQFVFWCLMLIGNWFILLAANGLETCMEARAMRKMNNAVRQDMTATLLQKSHRTFHELDTGAYLSWFTNDIAQIENLAWTPFFQCISHMALAVFSVAALLTLHWSLLAAALINAVVMLFAPRLFNKRMEKLGSACAREQAAATGRLKDLLAGYDVLRFFGREQRFVHGIEQASDQIEKPKFHLAYVKGFAGMGMGYINILCQMLINVLIGVLSIRGAILQSALLGGGNLCGNLTNGLGNVAQLLLSFSSAKPYFEKITVHASDVQTGTDASPERISRAITVENLSFGYGERPVLQDLSLQFQKGG